MTHICGYSHSLSIGGDTSRPASIIRKAANRTVKGKRNKMNNEPRIRLFKGNCPEDVHTACALATFSVGVSGEKRSMPAIFQSSTPKAKIVFSAVETIWTTHHRDRTHL